MEMIIENSEQTWFLVKEWTTKAGLQARIHKCVWSDHVKLIAKSLYDFHTGYVEKPVDCKIDFREYGQQLDVHGGVTFDGELGFKQIKGMWVGFDMAHLDDENNQNIEYIEAQCESLAEQIKCSYESGF